MNTTGNRRKKRVLRLICLAITITILLAGLWPFNFRPKNEVTWLNGQNGIHFDRMGIAYSKESVFGPQGAIRPGKPVSIELVVRPAREPNHSLTRILTFYTEGNRQFFTLAQWKSSLILRVSPEGNDLPLGSPEMGAKNAFMKNIPKFLTVISQNGNTAIYVNGQLMKLTRNFPLLPANFSSSGKFVLGNSPTGHSPWTGDLQFLAYYDRELPSDEVSQHFRDWLAQRTPTWAAGKTPTLLYVFDERAGTIARNHTSHHNDISIPATFHILRKNVLRPSLPGDYFSRYFVKDVAVNVLGFIPFGFYFALWLRKEDGSARKFRVLVVVALGGILSLTIELLQVYLPTRTSSCTDVLCNIAGTILGAYMINRAAPPSFSGT